MVKSAKGYAVKCDFFPFHLRPPSHTPAGAASCIFFQKYVRYRQAHANTPICPLCCGNWNVLSEPLCTLILGLAVDFGSFQILMHTNLLHST